ncbi:MAG: SpoIID/LytB domain-containing protein [Candidatus Brocadiae bacterium]|nr:SpoIID/LytB domain-containing protein [Candidatus Brocadiia bacterium]
MKTIFASILFFFAIFCCSEDGYQDLFTLSWGKAENELGFQHISLGGVSHEEGYFELCYGPQSIAVREGKEIFILDKVRERVAAFDFHGKFLRSIPVTGSVLGLCVSSRGTLVAYSPVEKYATIIEGDLAGKTMHAPKEFTALSEVWFEKEELWGRYNEYIARLDADSRTAIPFAYTRCLSTQKMEIGIVGSRNASKVIDTDLYLCDAIASGKILEGERIFVHTTKIAKEGKKIQELVCYDSEGNACGSISLTPSCTEIFSTYSTEKNGTVYELVIAKSGVIVRKWNIPASTFSSQNSLPESIPLVLPPTSPSSRATVNVWFRSSNTVKTMDLEEYIKGVVSREIYASWHIEAHKAMATTARTYAVARYRHPEKSPKAHVCDTTCCQAWTASHSSNAIAGVNATSGQYVKKGSTRISEPLYFSHCNGHTRNSEDYDSWNPIAYLRSQACICGYTSYYGHGVGLCQYGMQAYALKGYGYIQIIQHYYKDCSVGQ